MATLQKQRIMLLEEALTDAFELDNSELAERTGMTYNTIASWRFNYRHNQMSYEKKIEILTRLGYQFIEESKWKK